MKPLSLRGLPAVLIAAALAPAARADETTIAVAANFTAAATEIAEAFAAETGHSVTYSFGSTGTLYTQITQAAPYDAFLAADTARPERAEAEGFGVPGTRFTYATGKIALWSADPDLIDGTGDFLSDPDLTHVALANPQTAPYGAASVETMQALGVYDALKPKLVEGRTVTQTLQFIVTGNAPVGFVALSQIVEEEGGSRWVVPENLYAPIRQDAILLKTGEGNAAARAYLDFLHSDTAAEIVARYGYGPGE